MAINWSRVSDLATLVMISVVLWALAWVSYGWSLGETERLSFLIFREYAIHFSWVVQLGPQVFIVLGRLLKPRNKNVAYVMFFLAIALNLIDCVTNIGAFRQLVAAGLGGGMDPVVQSIVIPLGYTAAFLVTWAEEAMVLLLGEWFHVLGLIIPLPKFLMADAPAGLS